MSWAAHDIEPYLVRAKIGIAVSIPFCLLGSYSPDIVTKWAVYGLDFAGHAHLVDDPVELHRGWPGLGFTHTPAFGLLVALLIWRLTRSRLWAGSFLLGHLMHLLSETPDSVGVMYLFPFSQARFGLGMWEYSSELGRQHDAVAYYTGLGGAWDIFWGVLLVLNWRILTTRYFVERIQDRDPFWPWLRQRTNQTFCLVAYRASAFFGLASIVGWLVWSLFVQDFHASLDWSWGGPGWVPPP